MATGDKLVTLDGLKAAHDHVNGEVANLKSALTTKADKIGSSPDLIAGTAEQLMSTEVVEDSVPYLFRKSGGGLDIGNRETLEKIVGGTVAWNQLIKNGNFADGQSGWSGVNFTVADGVATVNIVKAWKNDIRQTLSVTAGHKYLGFFEVKMSAGIGGVGFGFMDQGSNNFIYVDETESFATASGIFVPNSSNASQITRVALYANGTAHIGKTFQVRRVQLFDLTQMFGTTIADYIYSLEQATPGAGVAWFRKLFPADYYPYNAGELISVSGLSEHKTVGFNLWDEEWEVGGIDPTTGMNVGGNLIRSKNFIHVFPNTTYYFGNGAGRLFFYDSDRGFISRVDKTNNAFVTPEGCHYVKFRMDSVYGITYNNDICVNFSDPSLNGEYEPYVKHSYPLDSSLTLRGIPKLDSENKLYYDGDEHTPDGKVNRRYGLVDLGTLTWIYSTEYQRFYTTDLTLAKHYTNSELANALCLVYKVVKRANVGEEDKELSISFDSVNYINVKDTAYTDAVAFKTAMSGVYLVYELATPTTEAAEPYAEIQNVDPYGTEEFVSDSIVPVGHSTKYPANLVKKLEGLPWNFATLIAPTESTTTATQPYAVGSYLIYQNTLYKVTSAIANGGTITPGTNVTATTIMAELASLA